MLIKTFSFIRQLLAPPFCHACKIFLDHDQVLCDLCLDKIRPVVSKAISVTPTKSVPVYAVGAYDYPLVSLILAKSSGNRTAAYQMGKLLWDYSVISHIEFDYVVPIPLHWSRYAYRGYNQADQIAQVIAQKSDAQLAHVLKRKRRTTFQSLYKGQERRANVQGVFGVCAADVEQYRGKHILLVDDVMTSGATLEQAARQLYTLKPASVSAAVLARVA